MLEEGVMACALGRVWVKLPACVEPKHVGSQCTRLIPVSEQTADANASLVAAVQAA
jgi:hypothetical protein